MDISATVDAPCAPEDLYAWVVDLARYPSWLDIVPRAVSVEQHEHDEGPAWSVDLRGRLGPFARAKRLRMVRTVTEPGRRAQFERAERDGREHSSWVLDATITDLEHGSRLTMRLHYGGRLWMPALDRLLRDEIERSRPRLLARLSE